MTFHEEAITAGCKRALAYLARLDFMSDYYLAGGTALALQLGHRISTDLDFFSTKRLLHYREREQIVRKLRESGEFEIVSEEDGLLFTRLFETDVSWLYQQHPLLQPTATYNSIELASPTDIGLMKLAAVNSRGTRRDFVDLYCLREVVSLEALLELVPKKYTDRPDFLAIAVKALAYFEDAEQQPMPEMLHPVTWKEVRAYCERAAASLARKLSGLA